MESYKEWLEIAKEDLAFAQVKVGDNVSYRNHCFHAQQAVEKALKGLLVFLGIKPEYTHNIRSLLVELAKHIDISTLPEQLPQMSSFAVQGRYPGSYAPISSEEYTEYLKITSECLDWVENTIEKLNENSKIEKRQ